MNIRRILGLVIVLAALVAAFPVSGYAADSANDWTIYLRPAVRFGTDHRTIFIIDTLAPVYRGDKDIVFINAKFSPDDHGAWETNAGVGYRRLVLGDRLVLGGNLFYDHRKTRYGSHFNQIGLGFEAMAEPGGIGLTTRFNYYQPLDKANRGAGFAYAFYGNGIYTAGMEEPMTGFDYEAGVRIPGISNYVETWAYAGGYNFFGTHVPNVSGFSARIEAMPTDFMKLDFEYRNDNINHDEFYGEVAFEVPFSIDNLVAGRNPFAGIGDVFTGSRTLKERMVEPVRRDVDIFVGKTTVSPSEAGEGNLVAGAIFVDASAPGGGDGSFEHPYNTLALAADDPDLGVTASIVHVLTGSGLGTGGAYFYKPGVTIWGAGVNDPVYPNVVNFVQGYPNVDGSLTMDAQNMTVLGLHINHPGGFGIYIDDDAADAGLSIFSNIIDYPIGYGIYYDNSGGLGTAGSPAIIRDNIISDVIPGYTAGISLYSDGGDVYAQILNNQIDGVEGDGAAGIEVYADGDFAGAISGNTISNIDSYYGGSGIYAYAGRDFSATIAGNIIDDVDVDGDEDEAYAYGIYAGAARDFTGSVYNNRINDIDAYDGYFVIAAGIGVDSNYGNISGDIHDNLITGVTADYGYFVTAAGIATNAEDWWDWNDTGSVSGSIYGNEVSGIGAYDGGIINARGILGYAGSDGYNGSISNNEVTGVEAESTEFGFSAEYISAGGIDGESYGDYTGSITGNEVSGVSASGNYDEWAAEVNAYGISGYADGSYLGSISGNTVTGISAEYAYDAAFVAGIMGDAYYGDFTGSIFNNKVSFLSIEDVDAAYALGVAINGWAWYYEDNTGSVSGSIYGNEVSDMSIDDVEWATMCGISGYADGYPDSGEISYTGSIYNNVVNRIAADEVTDYRADVTGISAYIYNGDFTGSIYNNHVGYLSISDVQYDDASLYGIDAYADGDFTGSIYGNTITDIGTSDYVYGNAYVHGIYASANNDFTGSIYSNTISRIIADDSVSDRAYGIYSDTSGDFTGSTYRNTITDVISGNYLAEGIYYALGGALTGGVTDNSITGLDGDWSAFGIDLSISSGITGPLTGNRVDAVGGHEVYGLSVWGHTLGSLADAMVVTGNSGTLRGDYAVAIYLSANDSAASSVFIGSGSHGMGNNSFISVFGNWDGNYPAADGPIYTNDATFINR